MGRVEVGLCVFSVLLVCVSPARILGIFPYRGVSHLYVFQPLMEGLARRGHQVTVVSHLPRKEPLKNYRDISVADPNVSLVGYHNVTQFSLSSAFYENVIGLQELSREYERVLSHGEVLALADSTFDLVFLEMFSSDLFFGLTYKIGAPVIGFSSCSLMPWTADAMAVPNQLAYLPNNLGVHGPRMAWWERWVNSMEVWASRVYYRLAVHTEAQGVAEKYLGKLPDLAEIAANTSLLFVNTHFTLIGQRPYPPSVIEVGGINLKQPKALPKELEKKLNDSSGVIYFSFGSVLVGKSIPKQVQELFLSVLSSSEKTVVWKMEGDLPAARANVITRPWFPQRDLLAHPKVELFISHCGLLGLSEAVISGVPVLCIPFYGDQFLNALSAEEIGIGKRIDFEKLTEEGLKSAVSEILHNKKYKERMREVAAAFKDRPMPPLETAIFWTEYLLRHGPKPFEGPFKSMPLWRREGLDLLLPLLILIILLSVLVSRLMSGLCHKQALCQGRREQAEPVKPKKKAFKKKKS